MDQDGDLLRVSGSKKLGRGVATAKAVEDGAAKFGAVNMVIGEAIKRGDTSIKKAVLESLLERFTVGLVNYLFLNPWV